MAIPQAKLVDIYKTMVRIRTFEERVKEEFEAGHIPGVVHVYSGQEAIAAGACAHLRTDDYVISTHRGHGHLVAKGGKTERIMAELYGRKAGYNSGKGGSMHVADMSIGMLGANGIVGAGIPIAGGCALSAQIRGTEQVVVCFFGDGATSTSAFHEGINMASVYRLAVVYVIENNQWFVSSRTRDCVNIDNLADRAAAYGIPGITVDGNDVMAVYEVMGEAIARARRGEGPTLVDCITYRRHGHMVGDPAMYMPTEEREAWMKKDPLPRCKNQLIEMGALTQKMADEIELEAKEEMNRAVMFADDSPYPSPEDTLEDIYA
ncbi:thiamine pyrophosphate-dependent dehydrogenase E1 component subunit alpha [Chloroflexota bacterium]